MEKIIGKVKERRRKVGKNKARVKEKHREKNYVSKVCKIAN